MGTFENLRTLASLWIDSKKRTLQEGTPSTKVDSGGTKQGYSFQGQEIDRNELREIKEIRESGGVISHLVHAKALMQFGTGAEFEAEEDEIAEYCEEQFDNLDNLLIEIGEDAIWYPYSIGEVVETRGGGFSHVELVEPWTMLPVENQYGEVVQWEQEIQAERGGEAEIFNPDEIASFILNKSSGRDKTGISEVKRAEQEITSYRKHSNAIDEVVDSAAWRRHLWKVGRDNGAVVDDNELRRFRNRVDNLEGDTQLVMGKDIEHELMDAMNPESFATITEHDLRKLSLALGLPLELANVGSDGLGSGMPAELRLTLFERQARAAQRSLTNQFVEQVVRPVLDKYSPYPRDADISLNLGDPVQANDEKKNMLDSIGDDMTVNERRAVFDKAPLDDDEMGEGFRPPQSVEEAEETEGNAPVGGGGAFFSANRQLQIPDNAVSIDDPSEAPEGAQIVEGERGGLYYVPSGEESDDEGGELTPDDIEEDEEYDVEADGFDIEGTLTVMSTRTDMVIGMDEAGEVHQIDKDDIESVSPVGGEEPPDDDGGGGADLAPTPELFDAEEIESASSEVWSELEDRHDPEALEETGGRVQGAETIQDTFSEWTSSGYWDSHAEPLWEALAEAGSGDGEIPDRAQGDNEWRDGTEEVADDVVQASREFAEEELFGDSDTITVYRGVSGDLGEQLQEAKEDGESVEVDPRAMESWSLDDDYAEQFGGGPSGAVMKREISIDDVGAIPALFEPDLLEEQEVTTVDNGSFEVPPEQIEVN